MQRRYYLSFRQLDGLNYPARVYRDRANGVSLHVVDPRATALEAHAASVDELEPWEHEAARLAFRQPPVGEPLDDRMVEGMVQTFVPESIRVPGEPAVQNPLTHTAEYHAAYGLSLAAAINERWGHVETYRHPRFERQGAA